VKEIGHRQVYDILQSRKPRATGGDLWGKRFSGGWLVSATAGEQHAGGPRCGTWDDRQPWMSGKTGGLA
jgi:hypothetical protein